MFQGTEAARKVDVPPPSLLASPFTLYRFPVCRILASPIPVDPRCCALHVQMVDRNLRWLEYGTPLEEGGQGGQGRHQLKSTVLGQGNQEAQQQHTKLAEVQSAEVQAGQAGQAGKAGQGGQAVHKTQGGHQQIKSAAADKQAGDDGQQQFMAVVAAQQAAAAANAAAGAHAATAVYAAASADAAAAAAAAAAKAAAETAVQPVLTRCDLLECDEPAEPVVVKPKWAPPQRPQSQPQPPQPERRTVEDILDLTTSGPLEALAALQVAKAEILRELRQRETN